MARISYPTEVSIPTPLLIEPTHLTSLDVIFDDFLTSRQQQGLNERSEDQKQRRPRQIRAVDIYLSGGKTIKSSQFSDAMKQPYVGHEVPLGFRATLQTEELEATVKLAGWKRELEIDVTGIDEHAGRELFGSLENWASEIAAPRWQQLWSRSKDLFQYLAWMWALVGLLLGAMGMFGVSGKNETYIKEAHTLLQQGINDSNQRRASELTLALISEYNPSVWKPGITYWSVFLLITLLLVSLSICPGVVIGIWTGKHRLQYWRIWLKTVWVTVPGLIFTSVLWPRILAALHFQ